MESNQIDVCRAIDVRFGCGVPLRGSSRTAAGVLGRKAFEQLEIDNLRKGYEFQLTRDPFNFVANSRLGHMLVGEGQTAQAIPLLSAALEVAPDSWSVLHNLGLAHVTGSTADLSRAQEYFGRALDANPDFAPARREMATVLAMTGQQEDSLAHFSQYLEARPDDAEVRGNFGVALARTNRSVEAEEQYRRALVDDPFNPTIYANLASLLQRTDRQDQAIAVLRSGIKNIARTTRLRLQLAAMLRNENPPTEARQLVREVLAIDPENAEARQAAEVLEQSR